MRGKEIRLERIMDRNTGKQLSTMDHGVSNGPIAGLIDLDRAVNLMAERGAMPCSAMSPCTPGHRVADGMLVLSPSLGGTSIWTDPPNDKVLVNTVTSPPYGSRLPVSMHVISVPILSTAAVRPRAYRY